MSWTPSDEERLAILERSGPAGAMAAFHIRTAIAQAHEQHRRAKAELKASRERHRQGDLDLWRRFGWLPEPDATFLRSLGIVP